MTRVAAGETPPSGVPGPGDPSGFRPTVAEVDLDAIRHNARAMTPAGTELMAVVKADGYGHGALPAARAAIEAGATWLGVALLEEALELRTAGVDAPILVLSEVPPGAERDLLRAEVSASLYTDRELAALAAAGEATGIAPRVHVKADTGMHRVGAYPPERAVDLARTAQAAGFVVEGLWTHFARSEDDPETTGRQLEVFLDVCRRAESAGVRPRYRHAANSGAVILHPETHLDLVRVGVALYGLSPGPGLGERAGLRPAMAWRSAVSMVRGLPAGEAVSYGHTYHLERDATVATVPVGYADGYRRGLSSRADVLIGGRRHRVAGTVTMDQIVVDCGDADVDEGDEVVLLGTQGDERITAGELAGLLDTIEYEIACGVGARVPRTYTGGRE
ncbi:MAG TPA: alanine racemase [Actinomycetota bacterium]